MSTTAPVDAELATKVMNPVLSAVADTFQAMIGITPVRTSLTLREPNTPLYELSAVIGISGVVKGSIVLSFAESTAIKAVATILGIDITKVDEMVVDGVGELANMIGGSAKDRLKMGLNLGLPNVIRGQEYSVEFPVLSTPMRVGYDSEIGPFLIEFGFVKPSF
jgi:chemotaxis protein CheX